MEILDSRVCLIDAVRYCQTASTMMDRVSITVQQVSSAPLWNVCDSTSFCLANASPR